MTTPVSTKTTPSPFDGLAKAEPDEPIFTLVGRDPDAPEAITHWVDTRRRRLLTGDPVDPAVLRLELVQLTEAEMVAFEFKRWRLGHADEDTKSTKRASYNAIERTTEQLDALAKAETLSVIDRHLREAAYHAQLAFELLQSIQSNSAPMAAMVRDAANEICEELRPKRSPIQ
jgi:hypothetical protein